MQGAAAETPYPDTGTWPVLGLGTFGNMGHLLPPPPADDRWSASALPLTDLAVMLRQDTMRLGRWVHGRSRTVLGARLVLQQPLARSLPGCGTDTLIPLDTVAALTLLSTVVASGADEGAVADVVHRLHEAHGGPVLASDRAATVLPAALSEAADRLDVPSLRRPLKLTDDGWVAGAALSRTLQGMQYDDDGWVAEVVLAEVAGLRIIQDRIGRRLSRTDTVEDVGIHLFRHGWSLEEVATVMASSVEQVEDTLRRRMRS